MGKTQYEEKVDKTILEISRRYDLPLNYIIAYKYMEISKLGGKRGVSMTSAIKSLKRLNEKKEVCEA